MNSSTYNTKILKAKFINYDLLRDKSLQCYYDILALLFNKLLPDFYEQLSSFVSMLTMLRKNDQVRLFIVFQLSSVICAI